MDLPALDSHELANAASATRANERRVFAILIAGFLYSVREYCGK